MENVVHIKNAVLAALAALGTFVANALGGWDAALQVLIGLMAADYVTGLIVAGVFKRSGKSETGALESRAGFKGLVRKCTILMLVWVATMLDRLTGAAYIRTAVCLFFIGNLPQCPAPNIMEGFTITTSKPFLTCCHTIFSAAILLCEYS